MSPPAMARSATPTSPGPSPIPCWSSRSTAANPLPAPARPFSWTDGKGTCHERIEDDRRDDRGHRADGFNIWRARQRERGARPPVLFYDLARSEERRGG